MGGLGPCAGGGGRHALSQRLGAERDAGDNSPHLGALSGGARPAGRDDDEEVGEGAARRHEGVAVDRAGARGEGSAGLLEDDAADEPVAEGEGAVLGIAGVAAREERACFDLADAGGAVHTGAGDGDKAGVGAGGAEDEDDGGEGVEAGVERGGVDAGLEGPGAGVAQGIAVGVIGVGTERGGGVGGARGDGGMAWTCAVRPRAGEGEGEEEGTSEVSCHGGRSPSAYPWTVAVSRTKLLL